MIKFEAIAAVNWVENSPTFVCEYVIASIGKKKPNVWQEFNTCAVFANFTRFQAIPLHFFYGLSSGTHRSCSETVCSRYSLYKVCWKKRRERIIISITYWQFVVKIMKMFESGKRKPQNLLVLFACIPRSDRDIWPLAALAMRSWSCNLRPQVVTFKFVSKVLRSANFCLLLFKTLKFTPFLPPSRSIYPRRSILSKPIFVA